MLSDLDPNHNYIMLKCSVCGEVYPVLLNCGNRLCPICNKRRFAVLFNRHKDFLQSFAPGVIKKIEFTLKNDDDLERMLERLEVCWRKLLAYGKKHWGWRGGFISIQTTNKGNGWHVHGHAFIEGDFVAQDEFSKVWLAITGDSYVVWIREVLDPANEFGYLVRYILKTDEVLPEFQVEYNRVFKGRRLLRSFGTWFNRMTKPNDDAEHWFVCPKCGYETWLCEYGHWISSQSQSFYTEGARPLLSPVGVSP